MTWNIEDCTVGSEGLEQHEQTCTGGRTMTGGYAHTVVTTCGRAMLRPSLNVTL